MPFCKTCGKGNANNIKFCISCGKQLSPAIQTEIANPSSAQTSYPKYPTQHKPNTTLFIILSGIGLVVIGLLVYFLINKEKDNSNLLAEIKQTNNDTIATNTGTSQKAETITEVPASQSTYDTKSSTTPEQHIRNYFDVTTTKVFDDIYPYLSYCTRYYNDYNPSRGSIYKAAIGYWGKVTNITQTINYVSVEYIENGKIGLVNMDYSFFSIKDQVQKYIKNLSLRVQLDDDNNIIEIYELSRDK